MRVHERPNGSVEICGYPNQTGAWLDESNKERRYLFYVFRQNKDGDLHTHNWKEEKVAPDWYNPPHNSTPDTISQDDIEAAWEYANEKQI